MQQQQQESLVANWRSKFNIAYTLLVIHQRAIVVPLRKYWGLKALALPCFWAFGLMVAWAALSRDVFMWIWVGIWLIALLKRRQESTRAIEAGGQIHSEYDGWPELTKKNEKAAKLVLEPFVVGWLGGFLWWVYEQYGMPVGGLPAFLLVGVVSLPFVEMVKQQIWQQKVQSMVDARVEQEALMKDVRERLGGN